MRAVLAVVEHDDGVPLPTSLEALTLARRTAESVGVPLEALALGVDGGRLGSALAASGVSTVHVPDHASLEPFAPGAWARCVTDLVTTRAPVAVVAPGTDRGHEVMAHAAARLDLPLVANATDVEPTEGAWLVTRQRWGGTLLEQASVDADVKLLTVAAHSLEPSVAAEPIDPTIETFTPRIVDADVAVRVRERVGRDPGGVSLGDARVVVGGGRGVGGSEGFRALEELAALLGGVIGCSRVVTNAGWRPHADQIGQTGSRIAPEMYIACGISGATQHIVGARGAKRILAINTDEDAPIMAHADYAIVGDLHAVVPALIEEIRRTRGA